MQQSDGIVRKRVPYGFSRFCFWFRRTVVCRGTLRAFKSDITPMPLLDHWRSSRPSPLPIDDAPPKCHNDDHLPSIASTQRPTCLPRRELLPMSADQISPADGEIAQDGQVAAITSRQVHLAARPDDRGAPGSVTLAGDPGAFTLE